jgi:uncharacterized protein DUF4339
MTNANNDVRELEDLLTELEGQGALPVGPYSDEDDAVTQLMDAPLGEQEWMVQITPVDRRMMSTEQVLAELATGNLVQRDMLVWRAGMNDWAPISRIDELKGVSGTLASPVAFQAERRPLPHAPPPPPTPIPPPRLGSSALASPGPLPPAPLPRVPLPAMPSTPFGAPRSPTPVPDAPPPSSLPLLDSAFGSPGAPPAPPQPHVFSVPPAAAAPQLPPTQRVNTQRPVAVDFSELEPVRAAPTRILIGSGLAALAMIVGTVYALSAGGVFDSNTEVAREPVAASNTAASNAPAARAPTAPVAAKPAEAKPAPVPEAKPAAAEDVVRDEPQTQPVSAKEELAAAPEPEATQPEPKAKAEAKASKPEAEPSEKAAPAAAEASKGDSEEASEPASTRAERRQARRNKRASASEESPAPRRSKPRAAAVASTAAAADADESAKTSEPPGSTFNRQAAKTALDDAAAQAKNCRPQGGQSGSGRVQVRYEPSGKVGAVSILTPAFDNTTTGDCVVMVFRRANIPAFTGSPAVVMNKNFDIP